MFQLQLQLRRLCNHGTFQKALCTSPAEDIQFDPEQAFELLQEKKMTKCTYCNVLVGGIKGIEDKRSGSFSVCGHLFCSGCVPKYEAAFRSVPDTGRQCPLCMRKVSENCIIHYGHHMEGVRTILSSTLFPLDGNSISSKVTALINDLKANANEGKRLVHYTFYKVKCLLLPSIVFSCWTRSLDLVAQHLSLQQTKYARIDGAYSLSQRQQVLGDYHTDTATRILLMTTGTGAVGYELPRVALFWSVLTSLNRLNLTIANCVYILEPQWNPMVENQAIGRVLRLGQKRNVKVVRYIVKGTVEEVSVHQLFLGSVYWYGQCRVCALSKQEN